MDNTKALMLDKLNEAKKEIVRQAELNKELNESKKRADEKCREVCILAANHYSVNLIDEIHNKSTTILKTNDFEPTEFKNRFADITTIKLSDIEFLNDREEEIARVEQQLGDLSASENQKRKLDNWLINIIDSLNRSNINDN